MMDKLPRKLKKRVLGIKMKKVKLRALLKICYAKSGRTIYDPIEIYPYHFCPSCGCEATEFTGNMVPHPELYDIGSCLRCGREVMVADNSVYIHCFEEIAREREAFDE